MTIVLAGGGTGGHITPILAVASELKNLRPDARLVYIGQKGDKLADIPAAHPAIDEVYAVSAGKFRRYHGEGWRQLFDLHTQALNVRDAFRVLAGIWQSYWLLRQLRPSMIFTRGGFVSVPVALGGVLNGIPYMTHDSDSTPSLANRLIAPWAVLHAVALPEEVYPYPRNKTLTVGVPASREYVPMTSDLQREYRKALGFDQCKQMLFITGGGNGAEQLNKVVIDNAADLLHRYPSLMIVHVAGRALEHATSAAYDKVLLAAERHRVVVKGFVTDLYRYSGAADVVITRGGASSLAEFAMQGKACIVIPAKLAFQVHHTKTLEKRQAIISLTQAESGHEGRLGEVIAGLLDDEGRRHELGVRLASLAYPDAAHRLAVVLLERSPRR